MCTGIVIRELSTLGITEMFENELFNRMYQINELSKRKSRKMTQKQT